MNKHQITGWVRPLMAMLCIALSALVVHADFTVWVYGPSTAPYLQQWGSSYTDSQINEGTVINTTGTWYYKTFSGSGSINFRFTTGNWANETYGFYYDNPSGDYYFYYDGSGFAIDLTPLKNKTNNVFLKATNDRWNKDGATFKFADNAMTAIGGDKSSYVIYYYATSSAISSGSKKFARCSSDGSSQWNSFSATYTNHYLYEETGWDNSYNSSLASWGNVTYPEITVTTYSATFYIYATSTPTMSGVTFTTVANDNTDDKKDAMFNWYKGTYSSTTWSGNVSFTANGSTKTLTLGTTGTTIADGGTYYFDSSNAETTADYNPFAGNVITVYARVSDYANAKLHAWRTTLNNATIDINGEWKDDAQLMNDGNETINGYEWYKKTFTGYNEIKAMLSSPESYAIDSEAAFSGTKYIYKVNGTNTVSTTAPAAPQPKLYLAGSFTDWQTSMVEMTKNPNGTYTYTANSVPMGAQFQFVYDDGVGTQTWLGATSGSEKITATACTNVAMTGTINFWLYGSGNLTFTVAADRTSFSVTGLTAPTEYTYNVYVRNTGDNNVPSLYAFGAGNDYFNPAELNAAFPGVAGSTTEVVNTYTWYKFTFTTVTNTGINVIANVSGDSHQTSDIPVSPGNHFIVFDGTASSTITPSYSSATAPAAPQPKMYIAGDFTTPTWGDGKLLMTENSNGTYSITVNGITSGAKFKFVYDPGDGNSMAWLGGTTSSKNVSPTACTNVDMTGSEDFVVTGNGDLTFTVAADRQSFFVTGFVANSLTIHVLNKVQGTTPWLWVNDGADVTSAWPGDQMSLTETINDETWHKMTVNTFENTVKAGVMYKTDGNVTWQTPDIQNIAATAGDWYIVVDSWAASKTDNVSCTYSSATVPTAAQQHNSNWYVHGNFAAATATGDAAWSHDNKMSTTDYTVYTWQVNLKSGYNYYFFPSDISSSVWTDINNGHRWAYYNTEQGSTVTGNSTIALNTWVSTRAQSTDANLHYYCESTSLHTIYFNAKTGEVKIVHETTDPTSEKLYLIGLARDNNDRDHVGNEWAANLGIEMTKGTDAYGEYFYATNINLLSFNSGFAFASKLGTDRDDWTTVNACRYGSIVNSGDQLVLYNENIETDVALANDVYSSTATKWIELYPVGQSQNTFTVETDGAYDIKFYKGDGTSANPPRVKLYRSDFPDAMYIIGGTISSWSDHKGVKMTRDTEATDEVFTTTTAFDIGATLAFSMRIGNWDLINQHRLGSASAADGDTGYWINNGNLGTEIALANYDSNDAAWTSGSKHNFNIQTNKSGVFNVTVNLTQKWVKFEQIREVQGHTVLVHLEKTNDITTPQLFAWDKETDKEGARISVDRPTYNALTTERKVLTVHENELYTTTVDDRDWYTWTIDNNIADFIITRGGKALANVTVNDTGTDTNDTDATIIEWRRSGEIFLHWNADGSLVDYTRDYDTYQAQEAPTETKMIDGHYYVYFINTMKWPKSYIYAWFNNPSTNQNEPLVGGYPGKVLTDMVCYDGAGNEVWLFDFGPMSNFEGREPTGLLFSVGDGTGGMQTGDFKFVNGAVYDYSGSVVLGRDLANIIVNGEADGQTRYIVEDDLVAVYYDTKEKMLYCKDLNKFKTTPYVARSVQQDGQLDYVRDVTKRLHGQMAASRYDQSNWVRLKIHAGASYAKTNDDLEGYASSHSVLKAGTVRGVLTDKINPTMELVNLDDGTAIDTNGTNGYADEVNPRSTTGSTINVYTTANFNGSQAGASGREYFFVTPKPCEYCNITWAVCTALDLEGKTATFTIPEAKYMGENEFDNQGDLKGYFTADISNTDGAASLEEGEVYTFQAIIELDKNAIQGGSGSGAPRKRANTYEGGKPGNNAYPYVVKPISVGGGVVTEVRDLNSDKKVTGVSYVNMAGQTSSKPFEGVNIVVTTYSDGSRSAVKVIR